MAISVREYGHLARSGPIVSLDREIVLPLDFEFLKGIAIQPDPLMDAFRLTSHGGHEVVQVQNFVGVVALPSGEQLEIVPKTTFGSESVEDGRSVLLRMLSVAFRLNVRRGGFASLKTLKRPWIETLIAHVLQAIARVARSGLQKTYLRTKVDQPFLRGQLRIVAQLRQRPGRQHKFHISYDEYSVDRPENRLLRSTLEQLGRWSRDPRNQRLCRELLFAFDEIPSSKSVQDDLKRWSKTRDMIRYAPLLPWVRLVLSGQSPIFAEGEWEGISLLFPMEQLFEEYVAAVLTNAISAPYRLKAQMRTEYLVEHRGRPLFQLKPDLVILNRSIPISVLDTKWKLIDGFADDSLRKYGVSQADLYQLFAYGQKYLNGAGEMFLIYPRHSFFQEPLSHFSYTDDLRLWAIPFDMETDRICWPAESQAGFFRQHSDVVAA